METTTWRLWHVQKRSHVLVSAESGDYVTCIVQNPARLAGNIDLPLSSHPSPFSGKKLARRSSSPMPINHTHKIYRPMFWATEKIHEIRRGGGGQGGRGQSHNTYFRGAASHAKANVCAHQHMNWSIHSVRLKFLANLISKGIAVLSRVIVTPSR